MQLHRLATVVLIWVLAWSVNVAEEPLRTWTDASGRFSIEARFISMDRQIVTLEKVDGSRVKIEITKLKKEDQLEASRLLGMQQAKAKAENNNPFIDAGKVDPNLSRLAPLPLAKFNWSDAKELEVKETPWNPPPIRTEERKLNFTPKLVSFIRNDLHAEVTGMVLHPPSKRAYVMTSESRIMHKNQTRSTFQICDLEQGVVIASIDAAGRQKPLAISDDGKWLVTREDKQLMQRMNASSSILTLWKVNDHVITAVARWDAMRDPAFRSDVAGASFLKDGTLLTWLGNGLFTWWELEPLKPRQTLMMEINFSPGFSPDGKIMAGLWYKRPQPVVRPAHPNMPMSPGHYNNLLLLDTSTGNVISSTRLDYTHITSLAFSPDGTKLAMLQPFNVVIYDLKTGTQETKLPCGINPNGQTCYWMSPTAVFTSNPVLFLSPECHANVWTYHAHHNDIVCFAGDHVFFVSDKDEVKVFAHKLPHAEALKLVDKTQNDPNYFAVKPGTKVKIELRGFMAGKFKDEVLAALQKQVKDAGLVEGEGGVSLLAWYSESSEQQMFYTQDPKDPYRMTTPAKVKSWMYQMRLETNGNVHWSTMGMSPPPPLVHLKLGESIKVYVDQQNQPNARFYQVTPLPRFLLRDMKVQAAGSVSLGRSSVSPEGVR